MTPTRHTTSEGVGTPRGRRRGGRQPHTAAEGTGGVQRSTAQSRLQGRRESWEQGAGGGGGGGGQRQTGLPSCWLIVACWGGPRRGGLLEGVGHTRTRHAPVCSPAPATRLASHRPPRQPPPLANQMGFYAPTQDASRHRAFKGVSWCNDGVATFQIRAPEIHTSACKYAHLVWEVGWGKRGFRRLLPLSGGGPPPVWGRTVVAVAVCSGRDAAPLVWQVSSCHNAVRCCLGGPRWENTTYSAWGWHSPQPPHWATAPPPFEGGGCTVRIPTEK